MIDRATVDKIYAAADIVDIISDFVSLKKKGINYQACCPFHSEKTPSFVVSPAKGVYKCFGCGKGGNAISFVMEHEGMTYQEALKYVARKYGIEVVEKDYTPEQKKENEARESMMLVNQYAQDYFKKQLHQSGEGRNIGLSYFRERGFTDAIIERFGLGYCPAAGDEFSRKAVAVGYREEFLVKTGLTIKRENGSYYDRFAGRVMFPVHSLSGRVIAFGGRIMRTDKKTAKYLNSPESEVYHKSNTLYGIYFARKSITEQKRCILVEGYTDVLSMFQSGIENVVASSGTSLTLEQIRLILRFTNNVTVIYDGDSAGIKASIRGIDMLLAEGVNVRVVLLPDGEDPDSFAKSRTATQLNEFIETHETDFITFKTNLLLEEVKNDPIGRAEVISDIVNSISVIPNSLIRDQYLKECSHLLDVDYTLISSEVEKKIAVRTSGKAGREVWENRQKKERYLQRKQTGKEEKTVTASPVSPVHEFDELEREIVSYLLKYGARNFYFQERDAEGRLQEPIALNVAETIIEELEIDHIELRNPVYKSVFEEYTRLLKESEGKQVDIHRFINHASVEISRFAVDVVTKDEVYRPSRIWSRFEDNIISEAENLDIAVPKVIAVYKLKVLSDLTRGLFVRMEASASEEETLELLRAVKSLDDSRKVICQKYSRIL